MEIFWRGAVIGFLIAAPVGPIGLLCIRRTLTHGQWAGFITGIGAATADATYGLMAALGLTLISGALVRHQNEIALFGGVFLMWLAYKEWIAPVKPLESSPISRQSGSYSNFITSFILTLANPLTILSFVAVFAAAGLTGPSLSDGVPGWLRAALIVAGVFAGSAFWWLLLSNGIGLIRCWITPGLLKWINRTVAIILAGVGAYVLIDAAIFLLKIAGEG